ncbi:hypothetical protein ABZ408_17390 [Streptomyces tibetensis]|uniref:Uncharacterized protein n=1 Tax=Streptomyces tibetensis TaxID=2382123 RepID=A0ABW6MRF2_9ACTN
MRQACADASPLPNASAPPAKILADPAPHISKSYALTGPELKDMHTLLGRPAKTVRWALENHPRIRKPAAA